MEINRKNRFASQNVSIAQMMYVLSKYKSHKIALFNSMKRATLRLSLSGESKVRREEPVEAKKFFSAP